MHLRLRLLFALLTLAGLPAAGQRTVFISRLAPGVPGQPATRGYRLDLFNESEDQVRDLSGYILYTRTFALRLPPGSYLRPMEALRIGTTPEALDIGLSDQREFAALPPDGHRQEGDFAILFDRDLEIVDAVLVCKTLPAAFLPATARFLNYTLAAPPADDRRWSSRINGSPDPAMEFLRIQGRWEVNARGRLLEHAQATTYRLLQARYIEGIVSVKWKTGYERDCYYHLVERSSDGRQFEPLTRVPASRNSKTMMSYSVLDTDVKPDRVYHYRIVSTDKFGFSITSNATRVRTEDNPGGFTFDVMRGEGDGRATLNVRFSARQEQEVRMQLMDEELREIDVLYYGRIEADQQNLVNYQRDLPVGKYYVIVSTERQRFSESFIVE
ncbi:MAG: hypothetical protein OHK0039_30790 [Bacteroidia bacterium]